MPDISCRRRIQYAGILLSELPGERPSMPGDGLIMLEDGPLMPEDIQLAQCDTMQSIICLMVEIHRSIQSI